MARHWVSDSFWTEALERYLHFREAGKGEITIDLDALDAVLFNGDGPAYRAFEAMCSVQEHEGWDGHRGAPRVLLALLQVLSELSIDARTVEGSPERAADRGRAEDLGIDMGELPSLGDPAVVRGLVQDFATEIINARADYNADKLSGEQAQQRIKDAADKYGAIVMGCGEGFSPLPWNSPDRLGRRIRLVVDVAEGADPGEALFLKLARSITDIAVEHESGRLSDPAAKEHLTAGMDSVAELLLGYPDTC